MFRHTVRLLLWLLGAISLALGLIGLFLPVLPTTPFVLLAAACWARASPRLHHWLRTHPRFGAQVRAWDEHGAIPRRGKWLSLVMMALSCLLVLSRLWATPHLWLALLMALICLLVGIWIWRRPDA